MKTQIDILQMDSISSYIAIEKLILKETNERIIINIYLIYYIVFNAFKIKLL